MAAANGCRFNRCQPAALVVQFVLIFSCFTASSASLAAHRSDDDAVHVGTSFLNYFEKRETLSFTDGVQFHWTADASANQIEIGIIARSTGWVGIGFNDKGTMKGLDIAVVRFDDISGEWSVGDYFSTGFQTPVLDPDYRQNFALVSAERNATHTAIFLKRQLETCDDLDIDIGATPLFVSYALGASDEFQYHATRGSKEVSFFLDNILKHPPNVPAYRQYTQDNFTSAAIAATNGELNTLDFSTSLAAPNYTVPNKPGSPTTYTCFTFNLTEQLGDTPVYYNGASTSVSHSAVHHATLFSCPAASFADVSIDNGEENCYAMPEGCETISAWVNGVEYIEAPDGVSNSIGGHHCSSGDPECRNLFIMQVHYENLNQLDDLGPGVDMTIYISSEPPRDQLGIYRVLVPYPDIDVKDGEVASAVADCPGSCTDNLPDGGVTIFLAFPHGHLTTTNVHLQHFRRGRELAPILSTNYFDFNKQAGKYLSTRVLPGDQFRLTCEMNNTLGHDVVGGVSTADEMCVAFLVYYPKVPTGLQACASSSLRPGEAFCGEDEHMGARPSLWTDKFVVDVGDTGIPDDYIPLPLEDNQCNIRAYAQINDPLAWEAWSLATVLLLIGMLVIFRVSGLLLSATSEKYRSMSYRHQANIKVYIVALVGLTASFALLMGGGATILAGKQQIIETMPDGKLGATTASQMAILGANLVSLVFLFELIAKPDMNWSLVTHHVVTIAVTTVLNYAFVDTLQTAWAQVGFVLALHAATEQPVYIALLVKRFSASTAAAAGSFYAVCVYTLASKTAIFVWSMFLLFSLDYSSQPLFSWLDTTVWPEVMRYLLPILVIALYLIQLWQAWILYAIGRGAANARAGEKGEAKKVSGESSATSSDISAGLPSGTVRMVATMIVDPENAV